MEAQITIKEGTFTLRNPEKLRRIIEGQTNSKGEMVEGLGEAALREKPELVLALYDKVAGYITGKQGAKVKTGSFYDFKKRIPRETPDVTYTYRINGRAVEMKDGTEKPLEVQAAEISAQVQAAEQEKRKAGRPRKTVITSE